MSEMQAGRMLDANPKTGIEVTLDSLRGRTYEMGEVISMLEDKVGPFLRNDVEVPGEGMKSNPEEIRLESDHQQALGSISSQAQVNINRLRSIIERFDR